jgi:hypothetical protein
MICHKSSIRKSMIAVALVFFVFGCGGTKSRKALSLDTAKTGDIVTVEGRLSLRGSTPFPMLMLEIENSAVVLVESATLQAELKTLSGMDVSVEGVVLPSLDNETRALNVESYELLPLPSGDLPMVGTILIENDQCVLATWENKRYWIRGDFADVFRDFEGAKVWVAGTIGEYALPEQPPDSLPFKVIQYGVLSPR